jgi:hypothetical protein
MLRWTAAGVVGDPILLQVRVESAYPDRVAVGAPQPRRALDAAEVADNVAHFTLRRRGPRVRPVQQLLLTGLSPASAEALAPRVAGWRAQGIEHLTLHLGDGGAGLLDADLTRQAQAVVVRASHPESIRLVQGRGPSTQVVVLLDAAARGRWEDWLQAAAEAPGLRWALTYPWPIGRDAGPLPPAAAGWLEPLLSFQRVVQPRAADFTIKNLPLCALGEAPAAGALAQAVRRSRNRWYVDAEHQLDQALAFFPDVLRFVRRDGCRFCTQTLRCDGAAEPWLERGLLGSLQPWSAPGPRSA